MYYVCVEDGRVSSIINYVPNAPETMSVYPITDAEYAALRAGTHNFNVQQGKVLDNTPDIQLKIDTTKQGLESQKYLQETDWQVMRHIREQALGIPTTLTQEEYIALEEQRQATAKSIVR